MKPTWKDIPLEFFGGGMDTRSPSGSIDFSTWRLLLNVDGSDSLGLCRGTGFRRYLADEECYSNQDLHDQLLGGQTYFESYVSTTQERTVQTGFTSATLYEGAPLWQIPVYSTIPAVTEIYCGNQYYTLGRQCREAITMLHSFGSTNKKRRLIAGTKSRLYASDESGGNWRIIADGLGGSCHSAADCLCSPIRFTAAAVGQTILFGNGVDYVLSWQFDAGPDGCSSWSAEFVQDLLLLNVDSAEIVQSWNGFAFLAGVRADGEYLPSRLFWSDYNDPLSWQPGGESLAGFHDFGAGERILRVEPIGGRLRVYTTQAIYDLTQSSSTDLVFAVQEIYRGPHVPIFRWSLVNTGAVHIYMSEDRVFTMAEYDRDPTSVEWIHRATGVIYNGVKASWVNDFDGLTAHSAVERASCDQVVGGYDPVKRAIWFSWPTQGQGCPSMSITLWPSTRKSSLFDHGFTAFVYHRPDLSQTMAGFMSDAGLCDPTDELVAKQGSPCDATFTDAGFDYLWNEDEDPDEPMGDSAFFSILCGTCVEDLCKDCDTDVRFVMASAEDKCLKEYGSIYYREMLDTVTEATWPDPSEATYELTGYTTLIQGDPFRFKTDSNKKIRGISVNFNAEDQVTPSLLNVEAGYGMQPDRMQWEQGQTIELAAIDEGTITSGRRPGEVPSANFFATGSFLTYRLWVDGTGGQFCISSMTFKMMAVNNCW